MRTKRKSGTKQIHEMEQNTMKNIDSFIYKLIEEQSGRTGNALKTMGKLAAGAAIGAGAHQLYKQNQPQVDELVGKGVTAAKALGGQAYRAGQQMAAGRPSITADPKETTPVSPPPPTQPVQQTPPAAPQANAPASGAGELHGANLPNPMVPRQPLASDTSDPSIWYQ